MIAASHWLLADTTALAEVGRDVLRDVGIAFCISVVIAAIIEVTLATDTFLEGLNAIMHRVVPSTVWDAFREYVIPQATMREAWKVTMCVQEDVEHPGSYVSTTTVEFNVVGLQEVLPSQIQIELDAFRNPTFKAAKVGGDDVPLAGRVSGCKLTLPVPLKGTYRPRLDERKRISVEYTFLETIRFPDIVVWWMKETTLNGDVYVTEHPADWAVEVMSPHPAAKALMPSKKSPWKFTGVLFAGQGFEIRFKQPPVTGSGDAAVAA